MGLTFVALAALMVFEFDRLFVWLFLLQNKLCKYLNVVGNLQLLFNVPQPNISQLKSMICQLKDN